MFREIGLEIGFKSCILTIKISWKNYLFFDHCYQLFSKLYIEILYYYIEILYCYIILVSIDCNEKFFILIILF